jgi:type IV pilus assembly protein PilW
MSRIISRPRLSNIAGVTLIELMISMVLALIIVIAVIGSYLGTSSAARMAEAQAQMQEDAQAALSILSLQLRMAGNNPDRPYRLALTRRNPVYLPNSLPSSYLLTGASIRGCDGNFTDIDAASLDLLACGSATTQPDSIAINYEADQLNTVTRADGKPTDCLGFPLPQSSATLNVLDPVSGATVSEEIFYTVADNRFYIDASTAVASPSLYCRGNGVGSTPKPIVENVEDMQITYGVTAANSTSTVNNIAGYLDSHGIATNSDLALLLDDAERWKKVVTVRVCIVMRTAGFVAPDIASARYRRCDGVIETNPPDLRLRRSYATTVVLRNRI